MRYLFYILAAAIMFTFPIVTGQAAESAERFPAHYHPQGNGMWDTWYVQEGDTTHVFYLQLPIPGAKSKVPASAIGHATSQDLLHWKELPGAIMRGDANSPKTAYDSGDLYTGSAVLYQGKFYNFYCGNHFYSYRPGTPTNRESICLATSDDGLTFTKFEGNPIIEPTRGQYFNWFEDKAPFPHHAHDWVDCRDILVLKDPNGPGWLGYCVMRRKDAKDAFESACIVLCRSNDLYHWTVGDPICTPNRFNCFEVPDVFSIDGRWFMIALTGDAYGQKERWTDKELSGGTIVFESDSPVKPFIEVKDNLLLTDKFGKRQGYSARTVERNGERLMLFTRECPQSIGSRLSWPVLLRPCNATPGSGLLPCYWPGCDAAFLHTETISKEIRLDKKPLAVFDNHSQARTWMLLAKFVQEENKTAKVTTNATANATANATTRITIGINATDKSGVGYQVELIRESGTVRLLDANGQELSSRSMKHATNCDTLRIVNDDGLLCLYINDILAINYCLSDWLPGKIVLTSDSGATLSTLEYKTSAPAR